jgi:hypothetical protein
MKHDQKSEGDFKFFSKLTFREVPEQQGFCAVSEQPPD